jgi:hypothetical protein
MTRVFEKSLSHKVRKSLTEAYRAYLNGDFKRANEALVQRWNYQRELALLQGTFPPDKPETVSSSFARWTDNATLNEYIRLDHMMDQWFFKAAEAYRKNEMIRSKSFLKNRWSYQRQLSSLTGQSCPDRPEEPEQLFNPFDGHRPDSPNSFSKVPRRPIPPSGGRNRALPLPIHEEPDGRLP